MKAQDYRVTIAAKQVTKPLTVDCNAVGTSVRAFMRGAIALPTHHTALFSTQSYFVKCKAVERIPHARTSEFWLWSLHLAIEKDIATYESVDRPGED